MSKTRYFLTAVYVLAFALYFALEAPAQTSRQLDRERPDSPTSAKTALVIGNGAYANAPLRNPVNDASDIASALRSLGFEVLSFTDLDQNEMKRVIREFGSKLRTKGGVGLFYYAGHGVQVKGINYLIPVGSAINTEEEVEYESVEAGLVLAQMESARNRMNIVILDACRNNPFVRSDRSSDKGLASINAPAGTLIAYSTAPGSVASDGRGRNGLYTQELLRQMRTPGLTIEDVFKQVRIAVRAATSEKQTPWESSSLTGEFYFSGKTASAGTQIKSEPRPKQYPTIENPVGMRLRKIETGEFVMGNNESRQTSPTRTIRIKEFWMSQSEVTVGQWKKVMGQLPSHLQSTDPRFHGADDHPVVLVSWNEAKGFIDRLNQLDPEWEYRLPSEAEWEYAGRAGTTTPYSVGNVLHTDQANFDPTGGVDSTAAPKPVGKFEANPFGLYDMHGNAAEWVEDIYAENYQGLPADGSANVATGNRSLRVFRGGSWATDAFPLRSDVRRSANANFRDSQIGFRVAARKRVKSEKPASPHTSVAPATKIVQESMFTFELHKCQKSGSVAACEFTVTNNDRLDRNLEVPFPDTSNGRTFDDVGGQSELDSWQIGTRAGREALLIQNLPVKAYFRFRGVSATATLLRRLDLSLETSFLEGGYFKRRKVVVSFSDISLQ